MVIVTHKTLSLEKYWKLLVTSHLKQLTALINQVVYFNIVTDCHTLKVFFSYFGHIQNFLYIEGNLKIAVY